jgi:phage shock protein C
MSDYCVNCGQRVNPEDTFCSNCGAKVEKRSTSYRAKSQPRSDYSKQGLMTQPKLYRSRNDRWLAGVCGGLAKHFNIDPILVRIGFILLTFAYFTSIILYIILAIFIEEEPLNTEFAPPMKGNPPY